MKTAILVAGSRHTKDSLMAQLKEYIPEGAFELIGISMEEGINCEIKGDIIIFSSLEAYEMFTRIHAWAVDSLRIICNRSINFEHLEEVVNLPKGMKVLLVNDSKDTTETCIANLLDIGVDGIEYVPYYPNIPDPPDLDDIVVAITPGEADKVPKGIPQIIDLGARIIDMLSLWKIVEALDLGEFQADMVVKKHLKKIISMAKRASVFDAEMNDLKKQIKHELLARGYEAKYSFDDIVGSSQAIMDAKRKAEKLGATELTVLIEGESGTGKELFASAMHKVSRRKNKAFIAVNFSALPVELVESELFGYVEGAFTGAKRGGKPGIFELADGGTIFLDEIGDLSQRVQIKLLRVLQEKEIMSVGDTKIKKIDIRIIAATNQNLEQLVDSKKFRTDLYYRLKVGHITLPPLRERKEDIKDLVVYFLKQSDGSDSVKIEREVMQALESRVWKGNVRELQSVVQYMLAIRCGTSLTAAELPPLMEPVNNTYKAYQDQESAPAISGAISGLNERERYVLWAATALIHEKGFAGRKSIALYLSEGSRGNLSNRAFTESQVRRALDGLEKKGYIEHLKGKSGIKIVEQLAH